MSETKHISPLLDEFSLGTPMSEHNGIQCCPAIKENTEEKYIVKIITIPASQVQLDALLHAGAYKDPADAMDYYKHVGEDLMQEAEFLKKLSKLDGFLSYEGWQMAPITRRRLGYELYLVGTYKHSLEKYVKNNAFTHLEAINLGLDLCSALSVCRQAGAIYVDLKPSNIFISEKKEYRIGDLGFVELDALRYTALPEKYYSAYTPPELMDPMAQLNLTMDSYAVGMILYQLYNDGQLPTKADTPEESLLPPINADYELAEIIMKAIDSDPEKRWQDPSDMGKALASYMQRNSINDIPITPHRPLDIMDEESVSESPAPDSGMEPVSEPDSDDSDVSVTPDVDDTNHSEMIAPDDTPEEAAPSDASSQSADETVPAEEDADMLLPHEMSEELSRMMAKADDLIAHETPEGVVIPEIPELPDPFAFIFEESDEEDDTSIPFDPVMEDPDTPTQQKKPKKTFASQKAKQLLKKTLSAIVAILVIIVLSMAAIAFYQQYYLQTIDAIHIDGDKNTLTVSVDTDIDPAKLLVTCSDHYGNAKRHSLMNGSVTFEGLIPNTMYNIQIEMDGFHKLVGQTSDVFTTDATTNIVNFQAVTGKNDGTVVLNFTVDGEEPDKWILHYAADGEKEKTETFTGHSVTINGLTIGKAYTFTLSASGNLSLDGTTSLVFLASKMILAENLTITSNGNSDMTIHWKAPGDIVVENWVVRCYNGAGYEKQLTVSDTSVYLSDIDPRSAYTVEVTAVGMTQPVRSSITANPINITKLNVDDSAADSLTVSWEYIGAEPEGGWLLMYSMDGGNTQTVVKCKTASALNIPKIPDANYLFTIHAVDGTSLFNNVQTYTCPSAELFQNHSLSAENVEGLLVKTPEDDFWHFGKLGEDAVTDQFTIGDPISVVLHCSSDFYLPGGSPTKILYVIRDAYGNVLPEFISEEDSYWKDLWYAGDYHYAELDIPNIPQQSGTYTLDIFFNGFAMTSVTFTITK